MHTLAGFWTAPLALVSLNSNGVDCHALRFFGNSLQHLQRRAKGHSFGFQDGHVSEWR
jgi:hypothetical protein